MNYLDDTNLSKIRKNNRTESCWLIFRSYLVKQTKPRVAVVHIFQKAQRPLSAKDVFEISQKAGIGNPGHPISLASAHRSIKVLKEINFLRQSHIEKDTIYYEI